MIYLDFLKRCLRCGKKLKKHYCKKCNINYRLGGGKEDG